MCKLFIGASPDLWEATTRSLRIDGMVTSVRLERYFWRVLEEIASRDSLALPDMLSRLYSESIEAGHNLGNFTSFLRVCAMRYLGLQMSGEIPIQPEISIASLDADNILLNEAQSHVIKGWSALADAEPII